ncbi:GntR family transcriptional regulator (plasmid) [Curtobacterium sp. MCSS17_016]|nr:GntR family transcriptional regulator [Curtobacterium sp. MCSS17_016]WIE81527.1 GntR family transcriptional regulator [Curtobacterium sp. MCSS17_016]
MPVPKSSTASGPRTLLRDVVYKQLLDAIEDGTLLPGERLNDDELTAWLSVSRTPVREAIARLASEGLVEMAANRYTRVASQSADAFRDAAELADAIHSHALIQAGRIDAATRNDLRKRGKAIQAGITAHDIDAYRELQDILGGVTAAVGNQLMADTEHAVRGRVKFHAPAAESDIEWDAAAVRAEAVGAL